MLEPFVDLTAEQATAIERDLRRIMEDEIYAPGASISEPARAPSFRGKAFHSEGVIKMWAEDDHALTWLQRAVGKLRSPRAGTRLTVKPQTQIPRRTKAGLLVPEMEDDDDLDRLRMKLRSQNPFYQVHEWAMYHSERKDASTIFLLLGIPEKDIEEIKARDRRVCYNFGSIYLRLYQQDEEPQPPTAAADSVPPTVSPATPAASTAPTQSERQTKADAGPGSHTDRPPEASTLPPARELSGKPRESNSEAVETDEEEMLGSDEFPSSPLFRS